MSGHNSYFTDKIIPALAPMVVSAPIVWFAMQSESSELKGFNESELKAMAADVESLKGFKEIQTHKTSEQSADIKVLTVQVQTLALTVAQEREDRKERDEHIIDLLERLEQKQ